ncbi:MAG: TIM barrel protein, partial [Oscillospiraceae bacterium]|nr:TIM barrel protein [Oscillospiraceae bacterium]
MKKALFGPAGNSQSFYDEGFESSLDQPAWLETRGLTAYEYQCGRGVNIGEALAKAIGEQGKQHKIAISLHAPYYISLASSDQDKRMKSLSYILASAKAVSAMGGTRIVVHPGGTSGAGRADALRLCMDTLKRAQAALDAAGLDKIAICPETMGKVNQLGDLDEVLALCEVDERFVPCVDFGHLNARQGGAIDYALILEQLEAALGKKRASVFHSHFSKIEYSAGGEKTHLTFADTVYGPDPAPLMALVAAKGWTPTFICESRGTQAE